MIPAHEAWHLLQWLSGRPRAWWVARGLHACSGIDAVWPEGAAAFDHLVLRRSQGVPLAQLLGEWSFFGHRFFVNRHTLIPRADSEPMVAASIESLLARRNALGSDRAWRVLDLGTGSGCLLISCLLALRASQAQARGLGLDVSADALAVARANAVWLGTCTDVSWRQGSWACASTWPALALEGPFDLVLANPPYIAKQDHHLAEGDLRFEPMAALAGLDPGDGLSDIRAILHGVRGLLAPGGEVFLEHGHDQQAMVQALAEAEGLTCKTRGQDLGGRPRWVCLAGV